MLSNASLSLLNGNTAGIPKIADIILSNMTGNFNQILQNFRKNQTDPECLQISENVVHNDYINFALNLTSST